MIFAHKNQQVLHAVDEVLQNKQTQKDVLEASGKNASAKAKENEITRIKRKYKNLPPPSSRVSLGTSDVLDLVNQEKARINKCVLLSVINGPDLVQVTPRPILHTEKWRN